MSKYPINKAEELLMLDQIHVYKHTYQDNQDEEPYVSFRFETPDGNSVIQEHEMQELFPFLKKHFEPDHISIPIYEYADLKKESEENIELKKGIVEYVFETRELEKQLKEEQSKK